MNIWTNFSRGNRRVRFVEDLSDSLHVAPARELIIQGFKQTRARLELVINGQAGHVRAALQLPPC